MREVALIPESSESKYTEPRLTDLGVIFRELLVQARHESGFSQQELARRLKTSQVLISRGEQGDRKIDVLELRLMCQALEIDFMEFIKHLNGRLSDYESNPRPLSCAPPERSRRKR